MNGAEGIRVPGMPGPLPPGERVLWSGAPEPRLVAIHVYHLRALALYFAGLFALWALPEWRQVPMHDFVRMASLWALFACVVLGFFYWMAWMTARTSTYVLTDRRLAMRVGIAFELTVNFPLTLVASAGMRRFRDGSGQIALTLAPETRVAYIAIWPHVRVFHLNHPQPVLRALAHPEQVAALLQQAVRAVGDETVVIPALIAGVPQTAPGATAAPRPATV